MRIDLEFCKTIERAERDGLRDALEYGRAAFPDRGIAIAQIGGALVGFSGVDSAFSQATGLGLDAEVRESDIAEIVEFYHARGSAARVITSPVIEEEVARNLVRRGFEIDKYENAMAADVTQMMGLRDVRIEECADSVAWADHSARAFADGENPQEAMLAVSALIASHPNVSALALKEHGKIVTTGCLALQDNGVAALFATATTPEARGRGFQTAMIADRIARALEHGATLARATVKPGTSSERNFRHFGFSVLYTRTLWSLPLVRGRQIRGTPE